MMYAFAVCLAIVVAVVQALLLRAVPRAASAAARGALLAVKVPLWAGFFVLLALADRRALPAGGIAAGLVFPVAAWLLFRKGRAREEE